MKKVQSSTEAHPGRTLCPCCGAWFQGTLAVGCTNCHARAIGEPLQRATRELPNYGQSLFAFLGGAVLSLIFVVAVFIEWYKRGQADFAVDKSLTFDFASILAAAEAVAWATKFSWLPLAFIAVSIIAVACRRIARHKARFVGLSFARVGFVAACVSLFSAVTLISITIPERLERRELARQAGQEAILYAAASALLEYQNRFGTLPGDLNELRKLPDTNNRISIILARFADADAYLPSSSLQASAKAKPRRTASRARLRNAVFNANLNPETEAITFTNYNLIYPGLDGIRGTADDLTLRDGLIVASKINLEARPSPPAALKEIKSRAANQN